MARHNYPLRIIVLEQCKFSQFPFRPRAGLCVPTPTEPTEEDDDWDDDDDSSEADDDGRIYKNPRNSPSTECPRDEEQATILVNIRMKLKWIRNPLN